MRRKRGLRQKKSLHSVKAFSFFCEIDNNHYFSCCVTPTGGNITEQLTQQEMTACEQGRRRESEAVVKPVETDDGREWSKLMKSVETGDTSVRVSLQRFFSKGCIFCLAEFERIKMF